jgi:hypothetical protein
MDILRWLFEAQIPVGGSVLILREVPIKVETAVAGPAVSR